MNGLPSATAIATNSSEIMPTPVIYYTRTACCLQQRSPLTEANNLCLPNLG
ncbi:MAG: hypothetical protein GPI96_20815 [Microcystis aeruginosa BS13-02]|nr:hypothetical protein [Microcystis aeruginosa BS13-02]